MSLSIRCSGKSWDATDCQMKLFCIICRGTADWHANNYGNLATSISLRRSSGRFFVLASNFAARPRTLPLLPRCNGVITLIGHSHVPPVKWWTQQIPRIGNMPHEDAGRSSGTTCSSTLLALIGANQFWRAKSNPNMMHCLIVFKQVPLLISRKKTATVRASLLEKFSKDTAPVAPDLTLFDALTKFTEIPDQEPMEWTEGESTAVAFIGENKTVVGWINGDLVANDFYLPFVQKLQNLLF